MSHTAPGPYTIMPRRAAAQVTTSFKTKDGRTISFKHKPKPKSKSGRTFEDMKYVKHNGRVMRAYQVAALRR